MRVRPFFWFLLALTCVTVLMVAALAPGHAPVRIQLSVDQTTPAAYMPTTLTLHLTDPDGLPIEQAQVDSSINMTNMDMGTLHSGVLSVGNGVYKTQLSFSMTGPWVVTFVVHADGFEPLQRTMSLNVT